MSMEQYRRLPEYRSREVHYALEFGLNLVEQKDIWGFGFWLVATKDKIRVNLIKYKVI